MKRLLIVLLLAGCASAPVEPLPEGAEASAPAVGSVAFWRWAGRAALALIENITINIDMKDPQK